MRMRCERRGLCSEPTTQKEGPQANREPGQAGELQGRENFLVRSSLAGKTPGLKLVRM